MRIASFQFQAQWLATYMQQQTAVAKLQMQVSSGQRLVQPSDDPAAAAQIADLTSSNNAATQYTANAGVAKDRLSNEDSLLQQAYNILQSVRELAVEAGNAATSPSGLQAIATNLQQDKSALLAIANSQDASGNYVFAGLRARTQPFTTSGGATTYNGDASQRSVQVGANQTVVDGNSGTSIFVAIPNGNGTFVASAADTNTGTLVVGTRSVVNPAAWDGGSYTIQFLTPGSYQVVDASNNVVQSGSYSDGSAITFKGVSLTFSGTPAAGDTVTVAPSGTQDVFQTIDQLVAATQNASGDAVSRTLAANAAGNSLENLDQALQQLGNVQASVGARLQTIDQATQGLADTSVSLTTSISNLGDTNYASAISSLTSMLTSLQAAQQTYAKVQGLSLFNYLR